MPSCAVGRRVRETRYVRVGRDAGSPVSPRYESPFEFTGDLREVTIQLGLRAEQEDEANGKAEMSRQ